MARNTEGSHGTHATLAHATRSEIITYLKHKDYVRVDQITENLGIPDSTLSGHITVMKPRDCSSRANPSIVKDLIVSL
jgi:hypothetical protein